MLYHQQGECPASDPASDEAYQRGTEMDILAVGLEDQEEEVLEDGMNTPPVYLTPSRSLPRLRVDTHSVRWIPTGYIWKTLVKWLAKWLEGRAKSSVSVNLCDSLMDSSVLSFPCF